MKVKELMTHHTATCTMGSNLEQAGLAMWNGDFGIVPIVDEQQHVIGVITDRDIAMATALQHKPPSQISVSEVAHQKSVVTCGPEDEVESALEYMETAKVRRLPVVDKRGCIAGMLTLSDVGAYATSPGKKNACTPTRFTAALKAIATPHTEQEKLVSRA